MIGFDGHYKRWIKFSVFVCIFFIVFWIGSNLSVFLGSEVIGFDNVGDIIYDRYHNCEKILSIILPNIYTIAFYYIFIVADEHRILRYGKALYGRLETRKIFIFSVLFSLEYMAVDCILMTVFSGISLLIAVSYYKFIIIKFIMLTFFMYMIGMTLYFLRNLLDFNKMYILLGASIYSFLGILYFAFMVEVSPAFYMNFAEAWFSDHTFDIMTYIINLAKLIVASLILKYLGQIIFLKRDIIGHEED